MSILLEALKKSEAQRQLGATPTLQTQVDLPSRGSAGWGRWAPVAMALVAAAAMTWAGWVQFKPPAGAVRGVPEPVAGAQAPAAATDSAHPPAADATDAGGGEVAAPPQPVLRAAQRRSTGEDLAEKRRLLGKSYRSYEPGPEEGPPGAPASQPAPAAAAQSGSVEPLEAPAASLADDLGEARTFSAPGSEPISYWQIPASLREGMPELRIRVLVFAERPEDRFLLINDKRLREGEELESGLRLEEIQRDRAIFTYQSYRFHLKG